MKSFEFPYDTSFPFYSIVIDINNSYDLLNLIFPGKFSREERFRLEKTTKPNGALLNTDEAAEYLSISTETLRRLCRRKAITFIQITPSEYRLSQEDLNEYISSRRNRRKSPLTIKCR